VTTRPIAEDLFTWPAEEPALIGGQCRNCEAVTFPLGGGCPRCGGTDLERHPLGRVGTLWSWTSQGFAPKEPFNGELALPWFVGVVELPGELRLETLLTDCQQDTPRIGMPMRLVIMPFRTDDSGATIVTFAFTPDKEADRA
jgi:uncharacterized OB-fold protein